MARKYCARFGGLFCGPGPKAKSGLIELELRNSPRESSCFFTHSACMYIIVVFYLVPRFAGLDFCVGLSWCVIGFVPFR